MRGFFKIFFASLLSLIVFTLVCVFLLFAIVATVASKSGPKISSHSVLVIDLGQQFHERKRDNPFEVINGEGDVPGLFDVVRLIDKAKSDNDIDGIYLKADANANGFASSNELRRALLDFRQSKKFVIAYGDVMSQGAYFVASAANSIYLNPAGDFEWKGYSVSFVFIKEMLDKLDIDPQIFYAGKFKSATEMFRTSQMTPENKLQTTVWLNELYNYFLQQAGASRQIDTATLHRLASEAAIQSPEDALKNKLVDGLKYDDGVRSEFRRLMGISKTTDLHLVTINNYFEATSVYKSGSDRVAVIFAEGNIVDGPGDNDNIGGDYYRQMIRKARMDKSIKAIVLRVNSGGGSALASENIWRELHLARQEGKPVVVSFGDVAASGGYYISCGADSIFTSPNTITGSIGVFGIIPDMSGFFKNKLGITFDGVKTAPYADAGAIYRPMNEMEKQQVQASIDRIYRQFKQRVAEGRKKDTAYIDSIAQGRVWSGSDAVRLGLADKVGNLQDAINSAARLAKLDHFGIREYPEGGSWLDNLIGHRKTDASAMIKQELGEEQYRLFNEMRQVREMTGSVQARLPFSYIIR